jgi:putative transposase
MANLRMTLLDLLNKDEQGTDPSFLRDGVRLLAQELMDAEATQLAGAGLHERSENRLIPAPGNRCGRWKAFLRQLVGRGLSGVRLITSDSHLGLKQAVAEVLVGATWQRCRVHFMRNALATVPKLAQQMVAVTLRTIFAQPDADSARETVERVCRLFEKRYPQLVACLRGAETDVLADYGFPVEHRRQIWSTNSLERLNREVGRRCEVVGIFPNRAALLRLAGAVLEEQNDEWAVGRRYFSTESMNKLFQPSNEEVVKALLELPSA